MTLNTTYKPAVAQGNGIIKEFSYSFNPLSLNYIKVYFEVDGKWVEQKTGWSATVSDSGGVVTFLNAPTTRVSIERDIPESQPTSYTTSSGFQAKVIENSFDLLTGMVQELKDASDRSVKVEVGDNQTPEELLQTVYDKLDSATEIAGDAISAANQAQTAADNATAAVNSAEQTLVQTQAYVTSAKVEIDNTKNTAINTINTAVSNAENNISTIVSDAEGSITNIAVTEANKAIANAAQEATNTATANVNNYVNDTILPPLQTYVDQAQEDANSAATSMEQAALSAEDAKTSETNALSSKNSAATSAQNAANSATQAKGYAQDAATSASLAQIENKISNCITKMPQDIKLELNNGTLTLKAGSKVYVPNGNNADGSLKFDVVTIEQDINGQTASTSLVYAYHPTYGIGASSKAICFSGSTAPSNPENNTYWYDTTNNKVKRYLSSSSIWREGYSLPICISSNTSIDQIFNGFGYIGSTVFALPGIEGLIPNGRNTEGSLNNIKFTTANVLTVNNTLINNIYMIRLGRTVIQAGNLIYDLDTNYNYNNSISPENKRNFAISGIFTSDSTGRITSFNPKQPIKLADEQEVALLARDNLYTGNNNYQKRLTIPARGESVLLQKFFNASQDVVPSSNEIGYIFLNRSTNYAAGNDGVNCFIVGQRDSNGGIHTQALARKYVDGVEKTSSIRATVLNTGIRACYATTPQENNGTIIVHNNDDSIVTSKWFNQKVQVVSTLPASPDANVYYFIPE